MNTTNATGQFTRPTYRRPAGLACPSCGCTEMRGMLHPFPTGRHRVRLECAACRAFRCWLPEPGAVGYYTEASPEDAHAAERAPPPEGCPWIGHVRWADGLWRPVVLASTLGQAWEELLGMPGRADLLIVPTQDTRKPADAPSRN